MTQSRIMSMAVAVTNVVVGFGIAVVAQFLIFPVYGLQVTLVQNLQLGLPFTVVPIGRAYALRRLFEAIRTRSG